MGLFNGKISRSPLFGARADECGTILAILEMRADCKSATSGSLLLLREDCLLEFDEAGVSAFVVSALEPKQRLQPVKIESEGVDQ
jgi:hypothetical protein